MDREAVSRWVEEYERAWREDDDSAVERLFTETAAYRRSPYESPEIGHAGIRGFWLSDSGRTFSMDAAIVAVEDDIAVVRVDVVYISPTQQEYRDLWILRFAADGRVCEFEEWAYWPGKPYTAE
jgi:hypothetical protein